jgi:hypothetical protein
MEEISFGNFFKFLGTSKVQIPIIETALVQNEMIESILFTDDFGFVKKRSIPKPISLNSYFSRLLEENDWKNRLHSEKNNKICWFFKKSHRTLILDTRIKEILTKPRYLLNIDFIQKYIEPLSMIDKPLTLKLVYLNNQYVADIFFGQSKVNDPITLNLIFDISIILIHAFESSFIKRVVHIEVEFIKESASRVLLSNVNKCVLIEAKYTLGYSLHKNEDLETLIKSLPKNIPSKSPKTIRESFSEKLPPLNSSTKEKSIYLFKRGQLRNIHSNLDSPIRITPSFQMQEELFLPEKIEEKTAESMVDLNYASESPDPADERTPDKQLINELLRGFFIKKSFSVPNLPERPAVKSPLETQKWSNQGRRQLNSIKTLPKINRKAKKGYENDFIELVMNTYCKNKEGSVECRSGDFGLPSNITSDEFSLFISNVDQPKELQQKNFDRIVEESYISGSSSPVEPYPRMKFEIQFVSNILNKRKDIFKRVKSKKPGNRQKLLSLILKSPRGKSFNVNKKEN